MSIKETIALFKEKGLSALNEEQIKTLRDNVDMLSEEEKSAFESQVKELDTLGEVAGEIKGMMKEELSSFKKELHTEIDLNVKEYLKQERELIAKQVGVYQPDVKAQRQKANELFRAYCDAFQSKNDAKLKEMTTDATGTPYAGYIVDRELNAEINHLIEQYGVARQEMTVLTLSKGSYLTNELVTDITVYWVDEGAVIRSGEVVLGQNTLELKKLGVIAAMTRELIEDGEIDLMSFVGRRVAEGFSEAEDEFVFNGDGTSTYGGFTGLLKQTTSVNVQTMNGTTFSSLTFDELLDMITATPNVARRNGKFYMHTSIMNMLRQKKKNSEVNNYAFQEPSASGPVIIWGKPVVEVEVMPELSETDDATAFVIFGDLRAGCIFGQKGGMSVDQFTAGTIKNVANNADINLITTDRTAVRFIERVGYFQIITKFRKPITILKTSTASA